jgi:DNA-binding response OmpR family regulator
MDPAIRVMVVDDERRICQNVEKILSRGNYQVVSALSASEALERLREEPCDLLISDIVMPQMNGLELLKKVKKQWPATKTLMMTAYASTDTALKAIRLGALDYLAKPFTPDELRATVGKACTGELTAAAASEAELEAIEVIDLDMPFDPAEVARATGEEYVKSLGRSDMPVVEVKISEALEHYCAVGDMVCDIFKKLGATCKAGTKSGACPQKKAAQDKAGKRTEAKAADVTRLVGIDMPFSYDEVVAVTGPEYVRHLQHEGLSYVPYAELKQNVARMLGRDMGAIDVDMPFNRNEVAEAAGEAFARSLGPSDMPLVEVRLPENVEHFCAVGEMVCDIFKKLGATCKAGTKSGACPQKKGQKTGRAAAAQPQDTARLVGVDMPFDFEEVAAAAGREYALNLQPDGHAPIPYERLKQTVASLPAAQEVGAAEKRVALAAGRRRMLVIDDEVSVNNNIRKILAGQSYRVDQAVTLEEALARITSGSYDVVMLDLRIPGVQGLELLAAVRRSQPAARVIIITGYASIETAVETARMGAVGYLPKPFTPQEIRKATENALRLAA